MTDWCQQQRLEWIAETLRVFGFIQRQHLERKFGISTPQASLDFKRYQATFPGALVYDLSAKCYRPAAGATASAAGRSNASTGQP